MNQILAPLIKEKENCQSFIDDFYNDEIDQICKKCERTHEFFDNAHSGSWIGYHSNIYKEGLRPRRPNDYFDSVNAGFSFSQTRGEWSLYDREELYNGFCQEAGLTDEMLTKMSKIESLATKTFEQAKSVLRSTIMLILEERSSDVLSEYLEDVNSLQSSIESDRFILSELPRYHMGGQIRTSDRRAMNEGVQPPVHHMIRANIQEFYSYKHALENLVKIYNGIITYIEQRSVLHKTEGFFDIFKKKTIFEKAKTTINNVIGGQEASMGNHNGDKVDIKQLGSGQMQNNIATRQSQLSLDSLTQDQGDLNENREISVDELQSSIDEFMAFLTQNRKAFPELYLPMVTLLQDRFDGKISEASTVDEIANKKSKEISKTETKLLQSFLQKTRELGADLTVGASASIIAHILILVLKTNGVPL
jgi:hypothetical protein